MKRLLIAAALVAGCSSSSPEIDDAGHEPPPDSGHGDPIDAGEPDAGVQIRNLGSDVPVEIDFILPFQGGLRADDWDVDDTGHVVLAGSLSGEVDLDPTDGEDLVDLGPENTPVVTVLGPDGTYRWSRVWRGRRGGPQPVQVAVAPGGDVYLMSTFESSRQAPFDLDPTDGEQLVDTEGVRKLFVVHLSGTGEYLGGFSSTSDSIVDRSDFITVDPDGHVWLAAWFQGTIDLDPSSAYLVLHSGSGQRKQFLARYDADLRVNWGYIPAGRSITHIEPVERGALFTGTFGGASNFGSIHDADLDPGPGVDVLNPGCMVRGDSSNCQPSSYFGRLDDAGAVLWTASHATVTRDRSQSARSATSGGPVAGPAGGGLLLGLTRDEVDFDWTSAELVYSTPWRAQDNFFDVYAQGVSADGKPLRLTRSMVLARVGGVAEATWSSGAWSPADDSYYATGWTQGAVIFPSVPLGAVGQPAESFLAAFDAEGSLRWAAGLGVSIGLGGDGAALVKSSASGRSFILGRAAPRTDLDFTTGLAFVDEGETTGYLVGFHARACDTGETRPCTCSFEVEQQKTTECIDARFAPCDCSQENLQTDGTHLPRPTPDCGVCAEGWTCDPVTWLCEDPTLVTLAEGLDHPTEVVDDGIHVYYLVQGRYPRTSPPPAQTPVGSVWRILRTGGTPEKLAEGGAASGLHVHDGYVYWAQQGLRRTASGSDGSVETISDDPFMKGPLAFQGDSAYWISGASVKRQPLDGGTPTSTQIVVGVEALRDLSVDPNHIYALAIGGTAGGLYRVSHGGGAWQRQTNAGDPRAMIQVGSAIYYSDASVRTITRFDTMTQQTTTVVPDSGGVVNAFAADGPSVYFTRYGLPSARTWTGEVWRLDAAGPTLVASSIQHASDAFVREGRVVFAEHGETRATTTTGRIAASMLR